MKLLKMARGTVDTVGNVIVVGYKDCGRICNDFAKFVLFPDILHHV
jgi:hypothetical protein